MYYLNNLSGARSSEYLPRRCVNIFTLMVDFVFFLFAILELLTATMSL